MTPSQPTQALPKLTDGPTPPPVFASTPQGKKPGAKSTTPTFLGAGSTPSQANSVPKTLTGQ